MKSPLLPHRFLLVSAAVAATGLAVSAGATAYYWKGGSDWADYGSLSNWSTESAEGADASALPGSGDTVNLQSCYFDMNGIEATLGSKTEGSGSGTGQFRVRNGILHIANAASVQNAGAYVLDRGTVIIDPNATLTLGLWNGGTATFNVNNGGTLQIDGKLAMWNGDVKIASGGTFILNGNARFTGSGSRNARIYNQGGSVIVTNGLANTSSANSDTPVTLRQTSGTLTLGGDIVAGNYKTTFTVSGGSIHVISDCAVRATTATMSGSGIAVEVDQGVTFSAANMTIDTTTTITKSGGGTFSIAPTTAPILLQNGSLGLATAGTYDLSNVTLASGASSTIALTTFGARIDSLPAALANAAFTADLSTTPAGTVIFYSADSAVLSKVKTDLAASVPQGFDLVISGEALSMEEVSDYIFNSTSVTDLLNASGWNTGSVPPANAAVAIDGANVVAEYISGTLPAWAAIEVKNGATLRTSADVVLPAITLNKNATLDIAAGTASLANGLTGVTLVNGDNITLPVLSIQTNATLTIDGDMKFKNVDFRLYGKLSKSSTTVKGPTFGYASSGETSYFAFTSDGGNFDIHSETDRDPTLGQLNFLCPESGGTVVAVGPITLRNSTHRIKGWNDMGDVRFGTNNPTNQAFNVVIDGTGLDISGQFFAAGAAHISLSNGSYIRRDVNCLGHGFNMAIQDTATIDISEGCYVDFTTGSNYFGIDSQVPVDAVTVRDGGLYNVAYNSSGWIRGIFVSDGGVLGVGKVYDSRPVRTDLLRGFGSARLDGDLIIASVENEMNNGHYIEWDRHVQMENLPFSGPGDVVVSNGVPAYPFSVTIRNGASTATGSIGVAAVEDADTTLYFADGANWAGTVKANGDVKLVKSFAAVTDATADAPAAVSFGGVELVDDTFKLRLWQNGTCDTIALGEGGWTGTGKLDFEFVGGFTPTGAEAWKIGSQPAGATLPAALKSYYLLYTQPSATEGVVDIYLKTPKGTAILLR